MDNAFILNFLAKGSFEQPMFKEITFMFLTYCSVLTFV